MKNKRPTDARKSRRTRAGIFSRKSESLIAVGGAGETAGQNKNGVFVGISSILYIFHFLYQ